MNLNKKMKRLKFVVWTLKIVAFMFIVFVNSSKPTKVRAGSINDFINDSRWKNGTSWDGNHSSYYDGNLGSGCNAYVRDFVQYVYGKSLHSGTKFTNRNEINTGDVGYWYISEWNQHWFAVIGRDGDWIHVAEGNYSLHTDQNGNPIGPYVVNVQNNRYNINTMNFTYGYHYGSTSAGPTITDYGVCEFFDTQFTVMANIKDSLGVQSVQYAVWTESGGQDDLQWYDGYCTDNNDVYWHRVKFSDHKGEKGTYIIDVYAKNKSGVTAPAQRIIYNFNSKGPTISNFKVGEFREGAFTVLADVSDINTIEWVKYWIWTVNGGQDDIKCYAGNNFSGNINGNYWARVNFSDHKNEKGKYKIHLYVKIKGERKERSYELINDFPETGPTVSDVNVTDISSKGYTLTCKVTGVSPDVNVSRVQFPTWTISEDQDDIFSEWWTNTKAKGTLKDNIVTYRVNVSEHNNETGMYRTHIYAYDVFGGYTCVKVPDVNVHDHYYNNEIIKPTKTEQGYTLHTCSVCGDTYKDNYTDCDGDNPDPIHTHTYSFEITKASTCTEKGIKEYTCSCGDSYTEDIPATGHKLASTVIEPTDENDGYTLHKCTNEGCDYEYKDNIVPHKTSEDVHQHKYVGKITKEPTCVEAGTMTYSCECGVSYTEGISAKGHSYEDQIIAPTPESRGYTLHTCSICNDSYKDTYTEYEDSSEVSTDIRLETEVKNGKIYFSWNVPDKAATYGIVYALDEQELDFAEKNNGYEISGVKANSDTMTYECATTLYENQPGGVWFRVVMKNGDIVEHSNAVKITKWNSERTDDGTDDDPKDTPKDSPEGNPSADPIDKQPQNSGDAQTTDQGVTHTSEKKVLPSVNITNGVGIYNGIKLYWKAVAGAAGYEVEYSVNSDLSNSKIDYLDYSSLGVYRVRNLLGNKVYYYRVRARRGTEGAYDYSEWTSIQKLTTMEEVTTETPTTTYSVPKIKLKSVKNNKRKTVTVKWKWNVKADGYQISYAKKKSFSGAKKKNANAYKESMTIKKLTKGKTYYVRVRAYVENEYGGKIYGKWSNVKKVKIKK